MRQIDADQPVMALRVLAPHEPPRPAKPQANSHRGGSCGSSSVETLTAYSHTVQAADLRLCHTVALASPERTARPRAMRPWSLRERLDERELAELITGYCNGATAASLATTHGVSLRSVKRLLRTAGVRRAPSTRESEKATPTTTNP
jgi:hypothetical protein